MTVKDVIVCAARLLSRADIADALSSSDSPAGEQGETTAALLYCANAVEDELSRHYFPIVTSEFLNGAGGTYSFSKFSRAPVKILKVVADGKEMDFTVTATSLNADAPHITVTYECAAKKKKIADESEFGALSENLLALGVAAEYCLIQGEISLAEEFENRYRRAIDAALSKSRARRIPPRRWV